jgi:hypothetical protein
MAEKEKVKTQIKPRTFSLLQVFFEKLYPHICQMNVYLGGLLSQDDNLEGI